MSVQKWGGFASIVMVPSFIVAQLIYLVGDWRAALGPLGYSIADLLYGPVFAAALVTAMVALRERIGDHAPRRMSLVLPVTVLAAGLVVLVALIRAANRQYHYMHPELHLESMTIVLVVWTTLVAGVNAAAWHVMGWLLVLLGWAGWNSGRLPRAMCAAYLVGGAAGLFVYAWQELEGFAILSLMVWGLWQGIVLLSGGEAPTDGKGHG